MSITANVPTRTITERIIRGFVGLYSNLLSHSKDRRKDDRTITTRNIVSLVSIVYL
jgi:hypothetical protein